MLSWMTLCLVSLTLAQTAVAVSSEGCKIDCNDQESDFVLKCSPKLSAKIFFQMYKDCLMWKEKSEEEVEDFADNIKTICAAKGVSIEIRKTDCTNNHATISSAHTVPITATVPPEEDQYNIHPTISSPPLVSSAHTVPITATVPPEDQCCRSIIFMVDGSGSKSRREFQKEVEFVKMIIGVLPHEDTCIKVSLLSFSRNVAITYPLMPISNKQAMLKEADWLVFEGKLTNTHLAFAAALRLLDASESVCDIALVLITDSPATDWPKTLESMVELYQRYDEAKTVVVAVKNRNLLQKIKISEVQAMASGVGKQNILEVDGFAALNQKKAVDVMEMILTGKPKACSQWAFTGTPDTIIGHKVHGVYEPGSWQPCFDAPTYVNTKNMTYLRKEDLNTSGDPMVTWTLITNYPQPTCASGGYLAAMPTLNTATPEGTWFVGSSELQVTVSCFH